MVSRNAASWRNRAEFLSPKGASLGRERERNAWEILEELLRSQNESPRRGNRPSSRSVVERFGTGPLYGWWPVGTLEKGRVLFKGETPIRIPFDSDVTAWAYKTLGMKMGRRELKVFLSSAPLNAWMEGECRPSCPRSLLPRVWHGRWPDEIDLVVAANVITALDLEDPLSQKVFAETSAWIELAIRSQPKETWSPYYFVPDYSAPFFLLYYDEIGPSFLQEKSRARLRKALKKGLARRGAQPFGTFYGGGETLNERRIFFANDRVEKRIRSIARRRWGI